MGLSLRCSGAPGMIDLEKRSRNQSRREKRDAFKAMRSDKAIIQRIIDQVVKVMDVEEIILFGSRAAETASVSSDYDILVVARTDLRPFQRIDIIRKGLLDLVVPLDILVVTPSEYQRFLNWKSSVVWDASRNGIVIYEAA